MSHMVIKRSESSSAHVEPRKRLQFGVNGAMMKKVVQKMECRKGNFARCALHFMKPRETRGSGTSSASVSNIGEHIEFEKVMSAEFQLFNQNFIQAVHGKG